MAHSVLKKSDIVFIKANRLKMSGTDMAKKLGVNKSVVNSYMYKNGLSAPKEFQIKFRSQALKGRSVVTKEDDDFIRENYLYIPVKMLADILGYGDGVMQRRIKQLGLVIPKEIIEQRKKDSQIKKGNIPPNKGQKMSPDLYEKCKATMFKKGQIPANAIGFKDGDITIRHDHQNRDGKPYKYIRLELGKWYPLHQYKWELVNGKPPKGHCLWFIDGDTMNTDLSNLELITRAENMRRNSCSTNLTDGYVAQTIVGRNGRHLYDSVLKDKDLLEVRRLQLQLNRKIKQLQDAQQK